MPKKPQPERSTTFVPKHRFGDCGVAALAGYLSLKYGDVAAVARQVVPDYSEQGMSTREMLAIARKLGHPMKRLRKSSLLDVVAIADVDFERRKWGHLTVLNRGLILDSATSEAIPVDLYLAREHGTISALYVLKN